MTDKKDTDAGVPEDAELDVASTVTNQNTVDDDTAAAKYGPDSSQSEAGAADDASLSDDPLDAPRGSNGEVSSELASIETVGDEDSAVIRDTEASAPTAAAVKKPGRFLAFCAFLFALLGLAGVGYLYYLLVYLDPLQEVRGANQDLGARYAQLEDSLSEKIGALETSNAEALAAVNASQAERLAANESAVIESLNEAINAAPPSQREWRIAEAEYLMRIANHRVLMEGDSKGALSLLEAADQIIEALDDFALHQVRARLADEIIALRQVPREDLQGVYLRLEALKTSALELPFDSPAYLQQPEVVPAEQTVWQTMIDELKRFVRVRTLENEESIKPLLAPTEEDYLSLNMRLAFEQAQLAVLKRHGGVFTQSLQSARDWIEQYMDADKAATQAVLTELESLLQTNLEQDLPDVSGSLNELVEIGRSGS